VAIRLLPPLIIIKSGWLAWDYRWLGVESLMHVVPQSRRRRRRTRIIRRTYFFCSNTRFIKKMKRGASIYTYYR